MSRASKQLAAPMTSQPAIRLSLTVPFVYLTNLSSLHALHLQGENEMYYHVLWITAKPNNRMNGIAHLKKARADRP